MIQVKIIELHQESNHAWMEVLDDNGNNIQVRIDLNPNPEYDSSVYVQLNDNPSSQSTINTVLRIPER